MSLCKRRPPCLPVSSTVPRRSPPAGDPRAGQPAFVLRDLPQQPAPTADCPKRALRLARAVESGNLSVNSHSSVRYWTPFGGMKQSGLGRELGPDALHAFTDVKNVFISSE